MRKSLFIGGFLTYSGLLYAILLGSSLAVFVDPPTAQLMLTLPVAFLLQAHGLDGLRTVKKTAAYWGGSQDYPPDEIEEAICIAESGARGTLSAAWLCMLVRAIQMLQGFTPEQVGAVGPAVAVMLLSYFYARILNQVFWHPIERWLRQQALQSSTQTHAAS